MKDQRRRTPPLAAPPLRRGFPSFTSSYVFGGAVVLRRSISSNSSMVTDEASPEGRSASGLSAAGSFCGMFRPFVQGRACHNRSPKTVPTRTGMPLGGSGPMPKIVKGGDCGWDMVVRLGEVLSSRRWQLGDVAL
jgi:hypothetical protein